MSTETKYRRTHAVPRNQKVKEIIIMKSTGMVRKVDELGRIVLPISIRQNMGIEARDSVEIFTDENRIILQKYQSSCIFCNNADEILYFNDQRICRECLEKLKKIN